MPLKNAVLPHKLGMRCCVMRQKTKRLKAAFAALVLSMALLAQPLTASAWMLDAEQQQLVDNLTSGREALLLGNYNQAVNDLSRAVQLNGNSVSAYYYRAKALQYLGRSSEAAADYSRVALMTRGGSYSGEYSDASSLAAQLGTATVGTSIFTGVLSSAAAGAQVTGADGQQRQATEEEAAMIKQLMDSQSQPQFDALYQQQFADPTDHAGVQEVVNKRTAALTATEETYATTDKETIYCGSGHTGICINGSDTIEIEKKAPTASDLVEHVTDQLNPFSSLFQEDKPTDHAPRYEKIAYSLSNPYTSITTEQAASRNASNKVKIHVPVGTQVKVLFTASDGVSVGVYYHTFTVDHGEKIQTSTISGNIIFVGE